MKKIIGLILGLSVAINAHAASIIDVYGVNDQKAKEIIRKYGKRVQGMIAKIQVESLKEMKQPGLGDSKTMDSIEREKKFLVNKIKKENGFLYVDFSVVSYHDQPDFYTTIEVIGNNEPQRLKFVSPKIKESSKNRKPDLIDTMADYSQAMESVFQEVATNTECPFYHCIGGFTHPKLKPYLPIFKDGIKRDRTLVIETLNNKDADPERRANAAFLIGHFNDPKEIISLLLPHVSDAYEVVRNNAMRVLMTTMEKSKIYNINIMPFIALLDSPYASDRNKALAILLVSTRVDKSKEIILKNSTEKLVEILNLKQINNHEFSYQILKTISGENFAENDIKSWRSWALKNGHLNKNHAKS